MYPQLSLSEKPKVLGLQEVADIFGVHPETVRRNLIAKKIYGFQVGNLWRIPTEEVERLLSGRPSLLVDPNHDDSIIVQSYINF